VAAGKSPIAESVDPTRWTAVVVAMDTIIFTFVFKLRIRRQARSGRGLTNSRDPKTAELEEVSRSTPELRRAPPQKGMQADSKHRTESTSTSMAPPAGTLPSPTLCTSRDPRFPQPPAAGATAGGGGNRESPASEVGRRGGFRKRLSRYSDGGEERPSRLGLVHQRFMVDLQSLLVALFLKT
jgi:hypothetical protein